MKGLKIEESKVGIGLNQEVVVLPRVSFKIVFANQIFRFRFIALPGLVPTHQYPDQSKLNLSKSQILYTCVYERVLIDTYILTKLLIIHEMK